MYNVHVVRKPVIFELGRYRVASGGFLGLFQRSRICSTLTLCWQVRGVLRSLSETWLYNIFAVSITIYSYIYDRHTASLSLSLSINLSVCLSVCQCLLPLITAHISVFTSVGFLQKLFPSAFNIICFIQDPTLFLRFPGYLFVHLVISSSLL